MNQILNGGEAAWAIETGWRYMFGSERPFLPDCLPF